MRLCLSVSSFDRFSLTIARWLTNVYDEGTTTENYTTPRDVTSVHIGNELLGRLIDHWKFDSVDDLDGAAFALWGKIRRGRKAPGKLFLFVKSLTSFVIVPEERI